MFKNTLLLLALLCCAINLNAQRNCGSMEILHEQLQKDPKMQSKMDAIEKRTQNYINSPIKAVIGTVTIPVVVHVVYNGSTQNISDAQIASQMIVLNDDFRRLNSDANNTWSQAADTEIEFCMATVDPNGNPTTGITRTSTSVSGFGTNDAVKSASSGGVNAWPASDYMNIWICDIGGGILGYAQFPGGAPSTDGVVCDYRYYGTMGTATAPFNLGRTMTHEVGHYLNLRHIWGDGNCNADDFVADTPTSDAANYGCASGHVSCSSTDMVQNYMDYSDDACMNLFTSGQKSRMRAIFDTGGARASLLNSTACGTAPPPSSCTDGVQNGQETGVDCGGPNCAPCPCAGTNIDIIITFDNYPEETSWVLTNSAGATVGSGGTYDSQADGSTITINGCLGNDCYDFTISDVYGDGICCSYGNGSYSVVAGGSTVASGGSFGANETTNFCLGGSNPTCNDGVQNGNETGVDCGGSNCAPCSSGCSQTEVDINFVFDNYPEETSWTITNSAGTTVASGGTYASQADGSSLTITECLANGCYDFTLNDSYGDGICCSVGNGSYSVVVNGSVVASGGEFTTVETTNFCIGSAAPTCSDGVQNGDETGVDCGGSNCAPCSTGGCTNVQIDFNNLDSGWGNWNDGGSDCVRSTSTTGAYSGSRSILIRDNTSTSVATSDNYNLDGFEEVTISWTYIGVGMESGEDFWLQASVDGGSNYQTITTYARGTDFENNVREFESVVITGTFTSTTKFRFRCDASVNNDRIYIDDILIEGCANGTRVMEDAMEVEEDEVPELSNNVEMSNVNLYPNPVSSELTVDFHSPQNATTVIRIFNMTGQVVNQISTETEVGFNKQVISTNDYNSGVYYMHISQGNQRIVKKFIVVK